MDFSPLILYELFNCLRFSVRDPHTIMLRVSGFRVNQNGESVRSNGGESNYILKVKKHLVKPVFKVEDYTICCLVCLANAGNFSKCF
jgi:type IV secretory pathway ATPase VirB11/archaellum biosynthesis ATPase